MEKYDYIFCGFGMATSLVLLEFAACNLLANKKILIIDQNSSPEEKYWSFWEKGAGKYDAILCGSWDKACINDEFKKKEILDGLTYKCICSTVIIQLVNETLKSCNVLFKNEQVISFRDNGNDVCVQTSTKTFYADRVFNSIPPKMQQSSLLLQHFEGWRIRTPTPRFNSAEVRLMDFSIPQQEHTRFMYVLPFSESEALLEYTLFSQTLLDDKEYITGIKDYLANQGITDYEILSKEKGVIPMTVHQFWHSNSKNVLHIGTAGGWTKASSGYTFLNAMKMAAKLTQVLKNDNIDFRDFHKETRFRFYDRLLVAVLLSENKIGKKLFTKLFFGTKSNVVLRFLSEETSILEELQIIFASPKLPFIKALIGIKK